MGNGLASNVRSTQILCGPPRACVEQHVDFVEVWRVGAIRFGAPGPVQAEAQHSERAVRLMAVIAVDVLPPEIMPKQVPEWDLQVCNVPCAHDASLETADCVCILETTVRAVVKDREVVVEGEFCIERTGVHAYGDGSHQGGASQVECPLPLYRPYRRHLKI